MRSYEFQSVAQNGYIKIPDVYKYEIPDAIKVIVVPEESAKGKKKSDYFPDLEIDMSGCQCSREERNERQGIH